jgi:hypothetical protein
MPLLTPSVIQQLFPYVLCYCCGLEQGWAKRQSQHPGGRRTTSGCTSQCMFNIYSLWKFTKLAFRTWSATRIQISLNLAFYLTSFFSATHPWESAFSATNIIIIRSKYRSRPADYRLASYLRLAISNWSPKSTKSISSRQLRSLDSSVGIAMGYGLDGPGSIPGNAKFLSSPERPDRLWGPFGLLSSRHRRPFPRR